MNKSKIGFWIALLVMSFSVNAQQAVQKQTQFTSGISSQDGADRSVSGFRLMMSALGKSKARLSIVDGKTIEDILSDNAPSQNTCSFLTAGKQLANPEYIHRMYSLRPAPSSLGMSVILAEGIDANRVLHSSSNDSLTIFINYSIARLATYLSLGEITIMSYPEIQKKRMSANQATIYLAEQIDKNFDEIFRSQVADLSSMEASFSLDAQNTSRPTESPPCGLNYLPFSFQGKYYNGMENDSKDPEMKRLSQFANTFASMSQQIIIARGPITSWRVNTGQGIVMISENGNLKIYRNGTDYISDSTLMGEKISIASSAKKDVGNSTSTSTNKMRNIN
ncbi:hypothetical protein M2128_002272 [Polynucleobacter sphagniphilus]|uniref:hypothetical protein n=1 Tax=Polynucleobacter sphagniphilus TaxID=1743169 RepID=UPI002473B1B7|nr:hypothetical protein [Polynucleobacter sphagniphilus]MDH6303325.1 hypothetical protein [Polynucleobacter sphagniphilus]